MILERLGEGLMILGINLYLVRDRVSEKSIIRHNQTF